MSPAENGDAAPQNAHSVTVEVHADYIGVVEFHAPPNNFFTVELIDDLTAALSRARDEGARAILLCSAGRHFCAGANFASGDPLADRAEAPRHIYDAALELFRQPLPIVAAVQGAAVGGGLGLAMAADFRVAEDTARFAAPFAVLGVHHGFGLSVTLPLVVGYQHALSVLYEARRIPADEALAIGLCDEVVPPAQLRDAAQAKAARIAATAPIALQSIRSTMREGLAERVHQAMRRERSEQDRHRLTADHHEGVRADLARQTPKFEGK